MLKPFRYWCSAAVLCTAVFFIVNALWIPAKAELAQWLLERTWRKRLAGDLEARPWPWADTWPVAVLEAPRLGVRELVLEGASGRNLAFGPAMLTDIGSRDRVISGHRDTHFAFLRKLRRGDRMVVTDRSGTLAYRVIEKEVVDSRERELVLDDARQRLTLLTCYPFDALTAGGPLRLVVTAAPVTPGRQSIGQLGPHGANRRRVVFAAEYR